MNDATVKIFEPDKTLQNKVGGPISKAFNENVIKAAEKVVENSADDILKLVLLEIEKAKNIAVLKAGAAIPKANADKLIATSFFVKSNAGLCGFPLVSEVAKSLYLFTETRKPNIPLTEQEVGIINWHVETIEELIKQKLGSTETAFGKELLEQLVVIKDTLVS